ncbi:integrating conjugative element protein, PFL_4693 family [Escherichia coli]|uniref:Integrating conjugative element protein, PFL_4693 family n=1 Tax=Escherichia coli TaxID=562 RepID=A0A376W950_ECOLX|nr:integrating conjugative element protein, PFL_4693 family [Escherichia coli]
MKMKNLSPVLMLLISLQTVAAVRESAPEGTRTQASSQVSTTTQALQQQAAQWGVTEEDYRRYRALMEGPRGMQSPGLDPLTVLGIEARTDAERRQLAEKWVKAEYERTEKELGISAGSQCGLEAPLSGRYAGQPGERGRAAERQRRTAGVVCESERLWHL